MERGQGEIWPRFFSAPVGMARRALTVLFRSAGADRIIWGCKFPVGPLRGTISRTARASIASWHLMVAAGKALALLPGSS